jgi:hypothetical protein
VLLVSLGVEGAGADFTNIDTFVTGLSANGTISVF